VGIFYFVNSGKGPFAGWNVSGRDYWFFAQNSGKTRFSTSALTRSCKRELGIISNPPPRLLIRFILGDLAAAIVPNRGFVSWGATTFDIF